MAHNLFFNEATQQHSFMSVQKIAWHGLGKIIQDYPTSAEAIQYAGLDYEVTKEDLYTTAYNADGQRMDVTKRIKTHFATMRTDTGTVLGVVGKDYQIVQNRDAFSFFDSIVGGDGIQYETAGALGNGERIFITAKLPNYIKVGREDLIEQYLFLTTSHDGLGSITAAFTPVRIVCANTLNAAMQHRSNSIKIRHTANAKERLEQAHKVMGISNTLSAELETIFNHWATVRITDTEVRKLIQLAMVPNKEVLQNLNAGKDDELSTCFKNMVENVYEYATTSPTQLQETTAGTVFGAYNAVTGYFQNVRSYKDQEAKVKSLFFGGTAQLRTQAAFNLCDAFSKKRERSPAMELTTQRGGACPPFLFFYYSYQKFYTMSSKIATQKKTAVPVLVAVSTIPEGEFRIVPIATIAPSPFNYRKVFHAQKMEELAASIGLHGIIENLTLRRMPTGRYELVAGERGLRAAKMAGLTEVPAIIKVLTDEQVREIQLTENLQREDPHPLEEAGAIGQMQAIYKTIDEIALRLGKSKTFVYSRLKLLSLIPDIQEMFIAEKLTMQEVLEIAALSPQSQQDFYNEYCTDWHEDDFDAPELSYVLNRYKYDLTAAPFNTKDKKLLPDVGDCTQCPFNTATLTSLFPEEAKAATCTNTGCYQRKCQAHFSGNLRAALQEHQPAALLFYGSPSPLLKNSLQELPEAAALPQYNYYGITRLRAPELPRQEDYTLDPETDDEEGSEPDLDSFNEAMEEYKAEREEYDRLIEQGAMLKGLLVTERDFMLCVFSPDAPTPYSPAAATVTAAAVQAAIKAGTATPELLEAEIARINTREARTRELDREKVQAAVHAALLSETTGETDPDSLTEADQTALRLLVLQSMDYDTKQQVMDKLFPGLFRLLAKENEALYDSLSRLTESQCSYLTRMALLGKPESKNPGTKSAYFLYQVAKSAGADVAAIEQAQQQKADTRRDRQQEKIESLQKKINKLRPAA